MLRIRDVYPGFWFLSIPDPKSRILVPDPTTTKQEAEKIQKLVVLVLYAATILQNWELFKIKIKNYTLVASTYYQNVKDPQHSLLQFEKIETVH